MFGFFSAGEYSLGELPWGRSTADNPDATIEDTVASVHEVNTDTTADVDDPLATMDIEDSNTYIESPWPT